MSTVLVIVGSSRKNGNSKKLVNTILEFKTFDVIELQDYNFSYFDYEHKNKGDEFLPFMKKITSHYKTLIFITPVYWYSMSGILKVFFDRITDLITSEKDIGRKIRGKHMAVVTTSNGDNLGELFFIPFFKSAEYLGMHFLGGVHTIHGETNDDLIKLLNRIKNDKD